MTLLEQVTEALSKVNDPELRHPITELGMIEDLSEVNGSVSLKVLLTIAACPMQDRLRTDITNAVQSVDGVKDVDLLFGVMNEEQRNFVKKVVVELKRDQGLYPQGNLIEWNKTPGSTECDGFEM
jgi:ATP-binding protein involved in chromosome partitioning